MTTTSQSQGQLGARLARLLEELARAARPLALPELVATLARACPRLVDVSAFATLDPHHYAQRGVYWSTHVELSCIGWRPGQSTPAHDHGGSACCVLVLAGVLTNLGYDACADGSVALRQTQRLSPGMVLVYGGHEIHRLANLEPGHSLFTLHLYSPPLAPLEQRTWGDGSA